MPGSRARRIRRLGRVPLPSLPELYPDARRARPVEIGLRTIDVAAIRGTAVGGGDQRGADFLPLRGFRGKNWQARWQRLPPASVDGWRVVHERTEVVNVTGAVLVEIQPPGATTTERLSAA